MQQGKHGSIYRCILCTPGEDDFLHGDIIVDKILQPQGVIPVQMGQHQMVNGQPLLAKVVRDFACGFSRINDSDDAFIMQQGGICIAYAELDVFRAVMRPHDQGDDHQHRAWQKQQTASFDGQETHTAHHDQQPSKQGQQIGLLYPKVGEGQRVQIANGSGQQGCAKVCNRAQAGAHKRNGRKQQHNPVQTDEQGSIRQCNQVHHQSQQGDFLKPVAQGQEDTNLRTQGST